MLFINIECYIKISDYLFSVNEVLEKSHLVNLFEAAPLVGFGVRRIRALSLFS